MIPFPPALRATGLDQGNIISHHASHLWRALICGALGLTTTSAGFAFDRFASFDHIGNPVRLQMLYRDAGDQSNWLSAKIPTLSSASDGQVAYLLDEPISGTSLVQQFENGSGLYRDANSAIGGSWALEKTLGRSFDQSRPGASQLLNMSKPGNLFYTRSSAEPTKTGYGASGALGYVFPRYGNTAVVGRIMSKGGVTLTFNEAAGMSLWHLEFGGLQFINNNDLGRQIQVGAQWDLINSDGAVNRFTLAEAGMGSAIYDYDDPKTRMGSPVEYVTLNNFGVQISKTLPLENLQVNATHQYGGSGVQPVWYRDLYIRKEVSQGVLNRDRITRWKQVLRVSNDFTNLSFSHNGVAAASLKANVSNYYVYNVAGDILEDRTAMFWNNGNSAGNKVNVVTGRCIILGFDNDHCVGFMAKDPEDGGSVEFWLGYSWKHLGPINETGEFANNTIQMIGHNQLPWNSGENDYVAYIISGTLSSVMSDAQALYQNQNSVTW